jgi:opacity protein-like surface antigen
LIKAGCTVILYAEVKAMKSKILIMLLIFAASSLVVTAQMQKPVDPVNWRELVPFLGDIEGWNAEDDAEGQSVSMGEYKVSQVERQYVSGEKELNIKIVDGGYVPMVYAGIKMAMNYEIDTSEEYTKKTTIKGYSAMEHYEFEDKDAQVIILIKDRMIVTLEGENFEDTSELKSIAELLDLDGIAELAE